MSIISFDENKIMKPTAREETILPTSYDTNANQTNLRELSAEIALGQTLNVLSENQKKSILSAKILNKRKANTTNSSYEQEKKVYIPIPSPQFAEEKSLTKIILETYSDKAQLRLTKNIYFIILFLLVLLLTFLSKPK